MHRPGIRRVAGALAAVALATSASGCYHFRFKFRDVEPPAIGGGDNAAIVAGPQLVTYSERRATWINGFVGTGTMNVSKYCRNPVRTELRVTAADAALSLVTLFIYTPHTLYVTCEVP